MKENKICFILCTNQQSYFDECMEYINRLFIPEGFEIEVLGVTQAKSMAAGYNEGMEASDAKYKVYLHQDVFIVYPFFLEALLQIFESDDRIGMIGMVGTPHMSPDGIMWNGYRMGNLHGVFPPQFAYEEYRYRLTDGLHQVEAVDGLLIATSKDIRWREDLLDGWDFYDVSQSFEMLRKGYLVVVPEQKNAWCVHDDGILNLRQYDVYRRICMEHYAEFFGESTK